MSNDFDPFKTIWDGQDSVFDQNLQLAEYDNKIQ